MMDLHCHLDLYRNPSDVIAECTRRKLYVLSVTTTPSAWVKTNALANGHKRVKTALGLHPQLAKQRINELALFDKLLPETRYVGEIGLDGSKENKPFWGSQLAVFHHILKQCQNSEEKKILSIHGKNAAKEVLEALSLFPSVGKIVLHWFSGSKTYLYESIDRGYWFSVNPIMFKSKNGMGILHLIPQNKILLESDGPFTQNNGVPLYPWDTEDCIESLSKMWSIKLEGVRDQLNENLRVLLTED